MSSTTVVQGAQIVLRLEIWECVGHKLNRNSSLFIGEGVAEFQSCRVAFEIIGI